MTAQKRGLCSLTLLIFPSASYDSMHTTESPMLAKAEQFTSQISCLLTAESPCVQRGVTIVKTPQQTNFSDCGIYVVLIARSILRQPSTAVEAIDLSWIGPSEALKLRADLKVRFYMYYNLVPSVFKGKSFT